MSQSKLTVGQYSYILFLDLKTTHTDFIGLNIISFISYIFVYNINIVAQSNYQHNCSPVLCHYPH